MLILLLEKKTKKRKDKMDRLPTQLNPLEIKDIFTNQIMEVTKRAKPNREWIFWNTIGIKKVD